MEQAGRLNFSKSNLNIKPLDTAISNLENDLGSVEKAIYDLLPLETQTAKDVAFHVFGAGGKRIRPAMFILASHMLNYRREHFIPMACVCEYIHTASLLHDDVIDKAPLRRGKPTVNSIWGNQVAVLMGDLIYARASEIMAATGQRSIVEHFARSIRLMSEGELLQLEHLFNLDMSEEIYLKILYHKTAVLISTACKTAGILAGASENQILALEKIGEFVGMAFQLIDDGLDFGLGHGDKKIGKKTMADIAEGKVTMPLILLREQLDGQMRAHLKTQISLKTLNADDIALLKSLVKKHQTDETTLIKARAYSDQAVQLLHQHFPPSLARENLTQLIHMLLWRNA